MSRHCNEGKRPAAVQLILTPLPGKDGGNLDLSLSYPKSGLTLLDYFI